MQKILGISSTWAPLGAPLSRLGLVGSISQLHGMEGRRCPPLPDIPDIPEGCFFMEAENGCLAVALLAASQNHRVLWVRKKLKDGPVPVPHRGQGCHSMVGEIPSFKGILIKDYQYFLWASVPQQHCRSVLFFTAVSFLFHIINFNPSKYNFQSMPPLVLEHKEKPHSR